MMQQLFLLRDSLSNSLEKLLDERNEAMANNDVAKESTAQNEAERIASLLSDVQLAINHSVAMNLNAIADRLEDSIEAQQAVSLSKAAQILKKAVERLRTPTGGGGSTPASVPQTGPVVAAPGGKQHLVQQIIDGSNAAKIDPITVLAIVAIESDFNPNARAKSSSAGGLFQFLDGTWKGVGGTDAAGGGGIGNGLAAHAPIETQIKLGCKFIKSNVTGLKKKLKRDPSPTATYMAHQQGLGGALKLLQGNKNAAVETVIGTQEAINNRLDGLTVQQAISKFNSMVRSHIDEIMPLIERTSPVPGGGATPAPPTTPGASNAIALRAVEIALSEMENFARSGTGIITEGSHPLNARVRDYFRLAGRSDASPTGVPWSAAFISFVMRNAGLTNEQFPVSANHAKYILEGLSNAVNNRNDAPIVYFEKNQFAPRVGDLVGFSRTSRVQNTSDMMEFMPNTFFESHTDLVIDVRPGKMKTIGGNVDNTIKQTQVTLDDNGKIPSGSKYFFVLRILG